MCSTVLLFLLILCSISCSGFLLDNCSCCWPHYDLLDIANEMWNFSSLMPQFYRLEGMYGRRVYSRDQLFAGRSSSTCLLASDVKSKLRALGIRRRLRGTRAGRKVRPSPPPPQPPRPIPVLCSGTSRDVCKHSNQLTSTTARDKSTSETARYRTRCG